MTLFLFVFWLQAATAQNAAPPMTTYQMVFLREVPGRPAATGDAAARKQAHLDNLMKLNRERVNLLDGPFEDGGSLRGIVVLDVPTADAARARFAEDPYVKTGELILDVKAWYGPKNWFGVPDDPPVTEHLVLGFLMRGPGPTLPDAEAEKIQQGHLAYMTMLHEQGKLLVAGPFEDDSDWRGIVIYRVGSVDEARQLAAGDPAVKAGRLVIDARPWATFKGILK
jgi:uncharacterized protein